MHRIVAVKVLPAYKVWMRFADGVEGEVDLSDLVGKGVFAAWNDPDAFALVAIDPRSHTLTWADGIDLAPDALYADLSAEHVART